MLNFKIGQFYKDTNGKEWRFCGYYPNNIYPYIFIDKKGSVLTCLEKPDNLVTEYAYGEGIRIPFVEEEEREWVIGEQYECYCIKTQKIIKVKLVETDNSVITEQNYRFKSNKEYHWLYGKGEVLSRECWVVFKNGIPEELKDRINKDKLSNKQKCFQKGQVYKDKYGANFTFIKRIKATNGLFVIFERDSSKDLVTIRLKKINNVECTTCDNKIDFCADESIRNEDAEKAVRIKE